MPLSLSVPLSLCVPLSLSVPLSLCLSLSLCPSLCVCLSLCLCPSLSVPLSLCASLSVPLSLCLSLCAPLSVPLSLSVPPSLCPTGFPHGDMGRGVQTHGEKGRGGVRPGRWLTLANHRGWPIALLATRAGSGRLGLPISNRRQLERLLGGGHGSRHSALRVRARDPFCAEQLLFTQCLGELLGRDLAVAVIVEGSQNIVDLVLGHILAQIDHHAAHLVAVDLARAVGVLW